LSIVFKKNIYFFLKNTFFKIFVDNNTRGKNAKKT
jgi:hypothetical protein